MGILHPLAELRSRIVGSDAPDETLRMADNYLHMLLRMGDDFILPAKHAELLPILEYYAGNLSGWVKYVKSVRDEISPKSPKWRGVYDFYRTILIRQVQRDRRDRLLNAVAKAVKLNMIPDTPAAKQAYADKCTRVWAARRSAMLDDVRSKTKKGHVSEEERAELLEAFWATVDNEIESGDLVDA